jgi:hypothetical protein
LQAVAVVVILMVVVVEQVDFFILALKTLHRLHLFQ